MRGYRWANNLVALFNQEKLRKPPDEELLPTVLNPTVSMNDQNCNKKQINKQINIEEPYLHLTWIIFFQNHIIMATFPTIIMPACIAAFWLLANLAKKVIFSIFLAKCDCSCQFLLLLAFQDKPFSVTDILTNWINRTGLIRGCVSSIHMHYSKISYSLTHQQVARNRPDGWYATRETLFSCPSILASGVSLNDKGRKIILY